MDFLFPKSDRGGGREFALFAQIFASAEFFASAHIFPIIRLRVLIHNMYLVPGTRHLAEIYASAEIFASGTRYQVPGTYHVL